MKRNNGETIPECIARFLKRYHQIPNIIKPSQTVAMPAYSLSFETKFYLHLQERKSADLETFFNDVEDLEGNMKQSIFL